jgi:sarcosine oxidase, subunit beta
MPLRLLKYGLSKTHPAERHFARTPELKPNYDVVIIGGGGHGLACAYYLAKYHGITNVAVLEKGYVGGGNTGRNTAIVRSNYLTPEGVRFYDESMRLYQNLSSELDFNIMYSERGHFTLAHTDSAIRTARWRAEVNKHLGVDSEVVLRNDLRRMIPLLNLSEDVRYPVMGALYHPPGAIARHDAVAWGYGGRASQLGVEIHQGTEVTGIKQENGRVTGVVTNRGEIGCGRAMQAVAGMSSVMAAKAGFKLPISSTTLQACVSAPLKPFLNDIVVSGSLHVYISQSSRGELVMGGSAEGYSRYNTRTTLDLTEGLMAHMLELFPFLGEVPLLRHWAGIVDMTPDFSPIMGETPIENYYIDSGWGTWGFKATPVCGKRMAETLATGRVPDILKPFRLSRFNEFALVGEKGAASVGH